MTALMNDEVVSRYAAAAAAHDLHRLAELRDGPVHRETAYWAAPLGAPEWPAPWVARA